MSKRNSSREVGRRGRLGRSAGRGTVPVLASDRVAVGGSLPGRSADDGPQLTPASLTVTTVYSVGATHPRAAVRSPVGSSPHQVPPGCSSVHGRPCDRPLSHAAANARRPSHGTSSTQEQPVRYKKARLTDVIGAPADLSPHQRGPALEHLASDPPDDNGRPARPLNPCCSEVRAGMLPVCPTWKMSFVSARRRSGLETRIIDL